ncbi:MAG: type II toxin-antitoxin system HigB family toxin [Cyclobacteriaceae bacterium]|nr:type II toxin-antitoxin system HigB family toxin [Cyclobacteriaceae bacterium]
MVVISKTRLTEFGQQHADAIEAVNDWWEKTKKADWASLADIKRTFNSVDYVGNDRYVFNIKGNRYRLVTMIFFDIRTLYIRYIDTHTAYDKIDCKTI